MAGSFREVLNPMPHGTPAHGPASGTDGVLKVVLLYAAFAALWILLSDKVVEWLFRESAQITLASTFKGWLFVAVTSLLLHRLMRRLLGRTTAELTPPPVAGPRPLLPLALIAVAIIVLTAGSIVHTFKHEKDKEVARLQAIADLKAGQIADWLRERDGDGHFVQSSRFFAETYRRWRDAGDTTSGDVLKKRLNEYREDRFFQGVLLLDEQNEMLWDSEGTGSALNPALQAAAPQAAAEGRALRVGPYLDADGRPRLDLVAPLLLVGDHRRPVVVLRVDPRVYLFPTLQTWPVPSASGEILLFRRDGDDVLFLNEHRHRKDTAAMLRMRVAEKDLLAAQVLRGEAKLGSLIEGLDYWGVPVMGVVRTIPGADWFLVAKMDRAELHVEANREALWIALTGLLALFMAAAGSFLLRQHQELVFSLRERETQAEKLRALELLDAIAEGSGDSIFAKDREGRYLLFNREGARLVGKRPQEVLGRDDTSILPPEQAALIIANDRKVMEDNRTITFQENLTSAHGEIAFLSTKGPLHDAAGNVIGTFGIARDITERKRAEEALRASEEKHRQVVENAHDAIFIAQDGFIKFPNPRVAIISGYSLEELTNKPFLEFVHPDDRDLVAGMHQKRMQGDQVPSTYSFRAVNKSGNTLWMELSSVFLRWEGRPASLNFLRDITVEKGLESQLVHAQKMEAVGTLAGGIAHDFNNLLQAVQGYVDLLLLSKGQGDPDFRELQEISRAAKRGGELTRQLLTFSRRVESKLQPVDLNRIVEDVRLLLERTIPKMIKIELHLTGNLHHVHADASQIEQILMNLAVNARDAMPDGGTLRIETKNIVLDEDDRRSRPELSPGEYVLLAVADTGQGIDKTILENIFDPFFTTKEVGKGTGLGLAMVYGIVKNHHGHITCVSKPGEGTVFEIYLPAVEHSARASTIVTGTEVLRGGHETVLLVDDDDSLRNLGEQILAAYGYTVLSAPDGESALQVYQECSDRIDLVVLDLIMPGMGGALCLQKLLEINPAIKIIVASGYSFNGEREQAPESGAKAFIHKPYDVQQMLQVVREVIDK